MLIGRRSEVSIENKILIYNTILKPVRTYGITLLGSACTSNMEMIQRLQNEVLRAIVDATWYIPNKQLHADLTISEEITKIIVKYKNNILVHQNELPATLFDEEASRRLKRFKPNDLTRFR